MASHQFQPEQACSVSAAQRSLHRFLSCVLLSSSSMPITKPAYQWGISLYNYISNQHHMYIEASSLVGARLWRHTFGMVNECWIYLSDGMARAHHPPWDHMVGNSTPNDKQRLRWWQIPNAMRAIGYQCDRQWNWWLQVTRKKEGQGGFGVGPRKGGCRHARKRVEERRCRLVD